MKLRELKLKATDELNRMLLDLCEKRQELNFKVANKQLKNVRDIRKARTNVAQIKTILKERESSEIK